MEEFMFGFVNTHLTMTGFMKALSNAEKESNKVSETEIKDAEKINNF